MSWTPKMVQAVLLKAPMPKPAMPLKVVSASRPSRQPSPRGMSADTKTGYGNVTVKPY